MRNNYPTIKLNLFESRALGGENLSTPSEPAYQRNQEQKQENVKQ